MIAGLATHQSLMEREGPYLVGLVKVLVIDEETFVVREPTAIERLVLDAHFFQDPTRLPWLGDVNAIGGTEVHGMGDKVLQFLVVPQLAQFPPTDDASVTPGLYDQA